MSAASVAAAQREVAMLQRWAGAPRPVRPGCSTVTHARLEFCSHCTPTTPEGLTGERLEVNAWRLLALLTDDAP